MANIPPLPLPVPHRGLVRTAAPWEQPLDSLYDGSNCLVRDGKLILRSGYRKLEATGFGERVLGGHYYLLASAAKRTVAGGVTSRKYFDGAAWADITGTTWTGTADDHVRFSVFPKAETIYLLGVNGKDATIVWDGVAATDSDLGGGAPIAKDITVCANRVIYGNVKLAGNSYPYSFMYSESNDHTVTKAGSIVSVGESAGPIIAVQNLGVQSFALYSKQAQFIVTAQGGSIPYRTDYRSGEVGPCSPACVVVTGMGTHFYLGEDGNVYKFDGTPAKAVGDNVQPAIKSSMNPNYRYRSHGVYDRANREIHFFWVPLGETEVCAGITYALKTNIFSPIHAFSHKLSASWEWDEQSALAWTSLSGTWTALGTTYPTWLSMGLEANPSQMLGQHAGQTYIYGGQSQDDTTAIDASWEYPARALAGDGMEAVVAVVEPFYKQLGSAMTLKVRLGTAKFPGGTLTWETAQEFDMSASTFGSADKTAPMATYENVVGRVVAVKGVIESADNTGLEWHGGLIRLNPREARRN